MEASAVPPELVAAVDTARTAVAHIVAAPLEKRQVEFDMLLGRHYRILHLAFAAAVAVLYTFFVQILKVEEEKSSGFSKFLYRPVFFQILLRHFQSLHHFCFYHFSCLFAIC